MNPDDINIYKESASELKSVLKKPTAIPAAKAPTGRGTTKGDMLVQRLASEFKHDPIAELVRLAQSDEVTNELKYRINSDLVGFYLPKVKAIDTNPNDGETISVKVILPTI